MEQPSSFIQQQNLERDDYQEKPNKSRPIIRKYVKNKATRGILFVSIFACTIPLVIYILVIDQGTYRKEEIRTCSVSNGRRIQCGKPNATLSYCNKINCCFDSTFERCFHYLPSKYYYHNDKNNGKYTPSLGQTPLGTDSANEISLTISETDENHLSITLHAPSRKVVSNTVAKRNYFYLKFEDPLSAEVYRNGSNDLILTTATGPTIISEKYWEWSVHLSEEYLFGLGETLIRVDEDSSFTKVIYGNSLEHNSLPIFMAYKNGSYHGLKVYHDGPLEVTIYPSYLISLKSLAGDRIELELSLGPTLQDVISQQQDLRIQVPEPWFLGVHLCRGGSSTNLDFILQEYLNEDINFRYDSDCIHENLFMALLLQDSYPNNRVVDLIEDLRSRNVKFALSLSPQVNSE